MTGERYKKAVLIHNIWKLENQSKILVPNKWYCVKKPWLYVRYKKIFHKRCNESLIFRGPVHDAWPHTCMYTNYQRLTGRQNPLFECQKMQVTLSCPQRLAAQRSAASCTCKHRVLLTVKTPYRVNITFMEHTLGTRWCSFVYSYTFWPLQWRIYILVKNVDLFVLIDAGHCMFFVFVNCVHCVFCFPKTT